MTTNRSYFFRGRKAFDVFERELLPYFARARASVRRLRIWCAAASSGQEPYSLAIQLRQAAHLLPGWRTDILGTDISGEILEKARAGLYSRFEVQRGLPIQLLAKHFETCGEMWQISSAIRSMVGYRRFSLLDTMTALGTFDIVFCRDVLMDLDRETKADILARIADQMTPDGALVLGAAETVIGVSDRFSPMSNRCGFFQKNEFLRARPSARAGAPDPGRVGPAAARHQSAMTTQAPRTGREAC